MPDRKHPTDVPSRDPPSRRSIDSKSINATWVRRIGTLIAIPFFKRIRSRSRAILILTPGICVKYGKTIDLSEAAAMQMIREKTSIPVPKILTAFTRRDVTYIVMEYIKAEPLAVGWLHRSEESKIAIHKQLRDYIDEMRRLQPPGLGIANVDGGSLVDPRIPVDTYRFGPFTSITSFHQFLRDDLKAHPDLDPELNDMIKRQDGEYPPPVFTHGDLSSLNILVHGDRIVGIIDWESAGWLPSYWEYTTACQVNPQNPFWSEEIDKFLDSFPDENAMEKVRQRWWGPF